MKKAIGLLLAVLMISGLAVYSATAAEDEGTLATEVAEDETCVDCGKTPAAPYLLSDGVTVIHICDACSSKCMTCGAPATKHYETYQNVVFACDGCYELATAQ